MADIQSFPINYRMVSTLDATVVCCNTSTVTVKVFDCLGLTLRVANPQAFAPLKGQKAHIYIHADADTAVMPDNSGTPRIKAYGFTTHNEKKFFEFCVFKGRYTAEAALNIVKLGVEAVTDALAQRDITALANLGLGVEGAIELYHKIGHCYWVDDEPIDDEVQDDLDDDQDEYLDEEGEDAPVEASQPANVVNNGGNLAA